MSLLPRPPAPASLVVDLARIVGARNVSNRDVDRLAYARDGWVRDRLGGPEAAPAAVVWPESPAEVSRLLMWAERAGVPVVPWGTGSGRCGAARPSRGGVVMDLKRLGAVRRLDEASLRCEAEAGVPLTHLERRLHRHGLTLGHDVHSGTVGGWIASRRGDACSSKYGMFEESVFGLEVVTPGLVRRLFGGPRPFDFPDFNAFFAGSEGTLGVITSAELRVRRVPASRQFTAVRFASIDEGAEAARELLRAGLTPAVARLLDPVSTWLLRQGSTGEGERWLERWLEGQLPGPAWGTGLLKRAARGALSAPSMVNRTLASLAGDVVLLLVFEGATGLASAERRRAEEICATRGGKRAEPSLAETWWAGRRAAEFEQAKLLTSGMIVDRLETATTWDRVLPVLRSVRRTLAREAVVLAQLGEPRAQGCAVHFTFGLRVPPGSQGRERYDLVWRHALHAVHEAGGAIGFDAGVGELKRPLLEREWGLGGMRVLRALQATFDPNHVMNPGKLADPELRRADRRWTAEGGLPRQISAAVGEKNLYVRGNRSIVRPPDERALASLLRVAGPRGVPVSSDQTGYRPRLGAVHLDLSRFEGVRRLSETALFVEVEAGVVVSRLERLLRQHGLTLGPVHPRALPRSVGSGLSRNLLVRRGTAWGELRDLCIGLRGLLADGTPFETRTVPASSTGPRIDRAFLGGHGRLGIITKASLRVAVLPAVRTEVAFRFDGWSEALTAGRRILQRGVRPAAGRIFGAGSGVVLALRVVAESEGLHAAQAAVVDSACAAAGGQRQPPEPGSAEGGRFDVVVEVTQRWQAAEATRERLAREVGECWIDFMTPEAITAVTRVDSREARARAVQVAVELEGRVVAGRRSFSPIDAESYAVAAGGSGSSPSLLEPESGPYVDATDKLAGFLDPGEVLSARPDRSGQTEPIP